MANKKEEKTATFEDIHGPDVMQKAYFEVGINPHLLAENDFEALKSMKPTRIKLKGALQAEDLPTDPKGEPDPNYRIIATTGLLSYSDDGEQIYGEGETLVEILDINSARRDRAVERIQRICDHIPAKKTDISSKITHVLAPEDIRREGENEELDDD